MTTPQYATTREPYDFRKERRWNPSPLQHAVIEHGKPIDEAVNDFRTNIIVWALKKHKGNQAAASRQLGINRTTLVELLRSIGLHPRQFKKYKAGDNGQAQETLREILDGM